MKIIDDISRYIDEVVSLEELKSALESGKKLTIKYGVDCTAPFLHLGHAVNLWVMRRFQEDGHKVVFLIGNFTSKIGDPTGRSTTRKMLSDEEIDAFANEFIKQVGAVLITDDPNVFEIRRNAEWYEKMPLAEFIGLCASVTHSKMISRDMFKKRIEEGSEISMNELLYPILQGYDSVMLDSDLTVVGTDQLFNEMMGRFFQEKFGRAKQIVMTTKITKGLWGEDKQSKSIGNFVALTDSPRDKFGKIMSLADDRIIDWMEVYTDIDIARIEEINTKLRLYNLNPRDAKLELAHAIVQRYHGEETANIERQFFIDTFSTKTFPADAPIVKIDEEALSSVDLAVAACPDMSRSQLRRVVEQGGMTYNGERIVDPKAIIKILEVAELKVGKRKFFKVIRTT
ncbi:MAG: tyrosine--tRNA ligase [Candidatus Saccharibacteria bacterium]|nr:tyrosine--tRNA ligase [Candidatus Saccharibacteria bacterium]